MKDKASVNSKKIKTFNIDEEFVRRSIFEMLLKNKEFSKLVDEKDIVLVATWLVSKWDDPDVFAKIEIVEVIP